MRRTIKSILSISAAALVLSVAGNADAETKLNYGSFVPAGHVVHKAGLEPFFERVTKDSGGSIKWELFVGGAMGGAKESLQTVRDGVVDSSLVLDVYLKRDLPVSVAVADLLVMADEPLVYGAAVNELHLLDCPQCIEEKKKHDMIPLAFYSTGTYALMCREDVKTLADMEGKKVRSTSRLGALVQHYGGTPVSITSAEMYEALQRGQADCTLGATAWLDSFNLKDVVKSIVDLPSGAYFSAHFMNMNENKWKSLSADQRSAIIKNLPKLVADTIFTYRKEGEAAVAAAVANGAKVHKPESAMVVALNEFRKGEIAVSAEKAEKAGVKNAKALLETFMAKVEKWRGIVAGTGNDQAKYEEALWREIYSKL